MICLYIKWGQNFLAIFLRSNEIVFDTVSLVSFISIRLTNFTTECKNNQNLIYLYIKLEQNFLANPMKLFLTLYLLSVLCKLGLKPIFTTEFFCHCRAIYQAKIEHHIKFQLSRSKNGDSQQHYLKPIFTTELFCHC